MLETLRSTTPSSSAPSAPAFEPRLPVRMNTPEFARNKYEYYRYLRHEAPVTRARVSMLSAYVIARYDDCVSMLRDSRFVRNRSTATGGRRTPIPLPKSVRALANSMIVSDDPDHKRLRGLVQMAFTPRALARLEERIEALSHELLDGLAERAAQNGRIDLIREYAQPIPVTVIREMVGVSDEDMPHFQAGIRMLSQGYSTWALLRGLLFDMPAVTRFLRRLIAEKRERPADDIFTALIHAEEDGERLCEDELVSMVWLLVIAGFETTVHLITNSVVTLLDHPAELDRLRAQPELTASAIEEVLRYRGPVHGTKPGWASEEVTWHGVTIPKGAPVMPLLGSANHDETVFDDPETFDITRSPNRHLGFGYGPHFCLGAALARMETRIALRNLFERFPDLHLAVPRTALAIRNVPMWHRHVELPLQLL